MAQVTDLNQRCIEFDDVCSTYAVMIVAAIVFVRVTPAMRSRYARDKLSKTSHYKIISR